MRNGTLAYYLQGSLESHTPRTPSLAPSSRPAVFILPHVLQYLHKEIFGCGSSLTMTHLRESECVPPEPTTLIVTRPAHSTYFVGVFATHYFRPKHHILWLPCFCGCPRGRCHDKTGPSPCGFFVPSHTESGQMDDDVNKRILILR